MSRAKNSSPPPVAPSSLGWPQAVYVQLLLIVLAQGLAWKGLVVSLPPPPGNWVVVVAGVVAVAVVGAVWRRAAWLRWLSGAAFAVSIIAIVAAIGLLGTVIAQDPEKSDALARWGFRAIFTSLPFAVAIILMGVNLAALVGRRLAAGTGSWHFYLNHVGLLVVIVGMLAGGSQMQKVKLHLLQGTSASQGEDEHGKTVDLGATVTLKQFTIEKFPPKLFVAKIKGMELDHPITDGEWVSAGHHFRAHGLDVQVLKYYPLAMPDMHQKEWLPSEKHGLPAADIRVTAPDGTSSEAWITPGIDSLGIPPNPMFVSDGLYYVCFEEQMPKTFRSDIAIATPGAPAWNTSLEVNQPVRVGNWMLYQNSYTISMGGRASVIEAVCDPALPVVYTGLVCMLLGAFLACWVTPRRREEAGRAKEEKSR